MWPHTLLPARTHAIAWSTRVLVATLVLLSIALAAQGALAAVCELAVDPQTVGLWHCDEGAGTSVSDASPNHYEGQLLGGPGWSSPLCGVSAVGFSASTQIIRFPGSITGNLSQGTVECSFNWSGNLVDTEPWVFDQFLPPSASNVGLVISTQTPWFPELRLRFAINRVFVVVGTTQIEPNRWYRVMCTWDGARARIYLDGVLEAEAATTLVPASTTDPLLFGADAGGAGGTSQFLGSIDEIRLSSVARAPAPPGKNVPVLLVPGKCEGPSGFTTCRTSRMSSQISCRDTSSMRLGDVLVAQGFTEVFTVDFGWRHGTDPRILAPLLGSAIDSVLQTTHMTKVNLVAHSMGGLVARWAIEKLGYTNRVANLVMIGTPNHGSEMSFLLMTLSGDKKFGYGWNEQGCLFSTSPHIGSFTDLLPGSKFLNELNYGSDTPQYDESDTPCPARLEEAHLSSASTAYWTLAGTGGFCEKSKLGKTLKQYVKEYSGLLGVFCSGSANDGAVGMDNAFLTWLPPSHKATDADVGSPGSPLATHNEATGDKDCELIPELQHPSIAAAVVRVLEGGALRPAVTAPLALRLTPLELRSAPQAEVPQPALLEVRSFPNPAVGGVSLEFALPKPAQVKLRIYDIAGRTVRTLVDEWLPAGSRAIRWDRLTDNGTRASAGAYFYELRSGNTRTVRKVLLLR